MPEDGRVVLSMVRGEGFHDIVDVWLFDYDGPLALEKATTDEVAQCRWMDAGEIRRLFEAGEFVDTLGYFFEVLAKGGETACRTS